MRVLFDGFTFGGHFGGVSRYCASLVQHLNDDTPCTARILVPFSRNEHLRNVSWRYLYGVRVPRWIATSSCEKASRVISPIVARWLRFDVLHETHYRAEPSLRRMARRVTTVHDMIHERLELDAGSSAIKAASVNRSDHVICVSENTRRDLVELLRVPKEKTSVVYPACEDFGALARSSVGKARINKGRPFLLHVGRRGGYKNFDGAVRALAAAGPVVGDVDLVSFGKSRFRAEELELARKGGLDPDRLVQTSGSDARLAQAYASATALILPSLHEGFGFPALEAMSAGCPVICSDASCIPEVVGDAGLYFDPMSVESMRHAIEKIATDDALRSDMIARGHRRWREFSWARSARETVAVYRNVLEQSDGRTPRSETHGVDI